MSRLYLETATTFAKISKKKMGLKEAIYSSRCPEKQKPSMLGLISKAVAHKQVLSDILNEIGAFNKESPMRWDVVTVMATELLFGSGTIRGGGLIKRFLMERLDKMKELLEKKGVSVEAGTNSVETGKILPRYVRVNASRWKSDDAAVAFLKSKLIRVVKDEQVPHLLLIDSADTKILVTLECVKKGDLMLQDKSTCVSAYALLKNRKSGNPIHILDVCSAPGGKAIHILEMLQAGDYLTAVERDPKRAAVLQTRLAALANTNKGVTVNVIVDDFLTIFPEDPRLDKTVPITHLNLDPSCSGSGMTSTPTTKGDRELRTLAAFQAKMLRHAQLAFETVKVVCYSTCSVLAIENEDVVKAALDEQKFQIDHKPLPAWWTESDKFVRTIPEKDNCRGFFLARIVRK